MTPTDDEWVTRLHRERHVPMARWTLTSPNRSRTPVPAPPPVPPDPDFEAHRELLATDYNTPVED